MKSLSFFFMFCFVVLACHAQNQYSIENLEKLSQEELNLQLEKAVKLQKSGKIINIAGVSILGGTVVTIAGVALIDQGDWALGAVVIGFFGGLAGVSTLAVGIPLNITGKKRIERINSIKGTTYNNFLIKVKPSAQYNLVTRNYQPGVTISIQF